MSLDTDTLAALDWPSVLVALSEHARTPMGRRAALEIDALPDVGAVHTALDEVDAVLALEGEGGWIPVGAVGDVAEPVDRAAKNAMLDKGELRAVGATLRAMEELAEWLRSADRDVPVLQDLVPALQVDAPTTAALVEAFDPTGDLSVAAFPILGELRQRIGDLHLAVRRTLDDLLQSDDLRDALQDRFVTQRGDRYVLPIKVNFKRKDMGIVHGVSGSGQTAFIEPHQVVALNNELRLAEGALEAEERRILTRLSHQVGRVADAVAAGLDVAVRIDLACARAGLSRALDGVRPIVHADSVVALHQARHPLLALRGVPVVANDLHLGSAQPILIISGPNTGGKTVALKTVGLCALLARCGCFIPARPGSRIDLFPTVVALIGDHQTVHGDHSSFSSHLVALKRMLDAAAPGCLYLIDEIASGTDPQQGAALAHAILERLLEAGPRAVVTTHFHRLKTVGAIDRRFAMGGMQFANGHPTFRLMLGASGESHALSVAEQLGFDAALLDRSRALMGDDEQSLADVLTALERERVRAGEATDRARQLEDALRRERAALAEREAKIRERAKQLEAEQAAGYLARLKSAEQAIQAVVADLQRDPSHRKVDAARATVEALRGLAPKAMVDDAPPVAVDWKPGDRVRLRKLGQIGEVVEVGPKHVQVQSNGMMVRVKAEDLEPFAGRARPKPKLTAPPVDPRTPRETPLEDAVRLPNNTVDLRGMRVEEGIEAVEAFCDRATRDAYGVIFILHGHGTGAMKDAVRRWLPGCPFVHAWAPADASQGGDAYTVAALR